MFRGAGLSKKSTSLELTLAGPSKEHVSMGPRNLKQLTHGDQYTLNRKMSIHLLISPYSSGQSK